MWVIGGCGRQKPRSGRCTFFLLNQECFCIFEHQSGCTYIQALETSSCIGKNWLYIDINADSCASISFRGREEIEKRERILQ